MLVLILALAPRLAFGAERATVRAESRKGFARLVIDFPDRLDLPAYKVSSDNGVLVVTFDRAVHFTLPDIAGNLPSYVAAARVDPDGKGIRFGLKTDLSVHKMEAGEQLYVDLLPPDWKGLPPALPPGVVKALAKRAQSAAVEAERRRKAERVRTDPPKVEVRVGRHPTFFRVRFDWNAETQAKFAQDGTTARIVFSWPMTIDLFAVKSQLPPQILSAEDKVTPDGSVVSFKLKDGMKPRFYRDSANSFTLDFDLPEKDPGTVDLASLVKTVSVDNAGAASGSTAGDGSLAGGATSGADQVAITPKISEVGKTMRIAFPFDKDTPAAVFRRGEMVWLVFDTPVKINKPDLGGGFGDIAKDFEIHGSGETQIVRIPLSVDRLATLGSQGRSWVLSLGDVLLAPTEPIALTPRRDVHGLYEVTANLERPYKVHQIHDPEVGDVLDVVTAFPPARGAVRRFDYVDFSALPSVQGLVVAPSHADVEVGIDKAVAVIRSASGLHISPPDQARATDTREQAARRVGFIDLSKFVELRPDHLRKRIEAGIQTAASAQGDARRAARFDLVDLYLANRLPQEALGVIDVMKAAATGKQKPDGKLAVAEAAADVLAHRPADALRILNSKVLSAQGDALMWRTIAKAEAGDYAGARSDALSSEPVYSGYPAFIQTRYLLSAVRAAVETGDPALAERYLAKVDFGGLSRDDASRDVLLQARADETAGRYANALDTYGQVIGMDVRPTTAEAVYRTLKILDRLGKLDVEKGANTLAGQEMIWRGGPLEAKMQKFLAELYIRQHKYRLAFETARQAGKAHGDDPAVVALMQEVHATFAQLFLDGGADRMDPVAALSLYYDFRELTPPGARGDDMVRKLAQRLVKVDLLDQAAELLNYQVANRLKGAARAQVAADLAAIEIANRAPEKALRVLGQTRLSDLPPGLERQRRILEARALIDAGRYDLALDLITAMKGRDVDLLRIDANWKAKRYDKAGEILESVYSGDQPPKELPQAARMNIVKAAVAYVLAGDTLGVSRVRDTFSAMMSKTPEWPMFDFVTGRISVTSTKFKEIAAQVAGMDSLDAFLTAYRDTYKGQGAIAPSAKAKSG